MSCQEFSQNLSLYVDDALDQPQRAVCDEHLISCPLCRTDLAEIKSLRRGLQSLSGPVLSDDLTAVIRRSVAGEIAARKAIRQPVLSLARWNQWFEFRLMPYTIGTFASVLLFAIVFSALQASINAFRRLEAASHNVQTDNSPKFVRLHSPRQDTSLPFSAADYAALRSPYALESPSLNPKSAFVSITSSLMRGEMSDDAVIVVADVFGNGIAKVSEVLEAPRNENALPELERVFKSEPAFVPAAYDKRPENMRVVLLIQKVEVSGEVDVENASKSAKGY